MPVKPFRPRKRPPQAPASTGQHGLARVISKRGICSRSQAEVLVRAGRVRVGDRIVHDPEARTDSDASIFIDDELAVPASRKYLMLNKPRGLVTTADDERGRDTVYSLFKDRELPWLAPVGRLDKASEGLLLFSNDSEWAARITAPDAHLEKTYHVQIDRLPDPDLLTKLESGIDADGERLSAVSVVELRRGEKNAWLEVILDEGRNRQIRRLLAAFDISVLRLVRIAIGSLSLGELGKGEWRELSLDEVGSLGSPTL
ncbi:pseudouridine synthase [Dokdonella sp.]|uniref:pseudouridine synthase n=1 Tax=Dokdonella sp. TaxID=2291710 RepID=UPI0035273F82